MTNIRMMSSRKFDRRVSCFQLLVVLTSFCIGISMGTYFYWNQYVNHWVTNFNWNLGISTDRLFGTELSTRSPKSFTANTNSTVAVTTSQPMTSKSLANIMTEEQAKRQSILQRVCEREDLPEYQKRWKAYKKYDYTLHGIVDDHYKIIFNYVPKVSCTTWKQVFMKLRSHHSRGYYTRLKDYPDDEIKVKLDTYRKVLFVREPVTRLLSAYLSKFNSPNKHKTQMIWEAAYGKDIVRRYRKGILPYGVNTRNYSSPETLLNIQLGELVQYITDLGNHIQVDEFTDHWLPIYRVANPCVIKYDFIGHYENLAIEGPYVLRWLGVDDFVNFPFVHDSRAVASFVHAYQQLPLELLRRLWKYYQIDYDMFGYSINDTVSILMKGLFE